MNERIRELAKQAYEDVIKNTPSFLVTKELYEQKFAELIVKECMEWCDAHATINGSAQQIRNSIKNHFGVEE
jgi:hypothetical protein